MIVDRPREKRLCAIVDCEASVVRRPQSALCETHKGWAEPGAFDDGTKAHVVVTGKQLVRYRRVVEMTREEFLEATEAIDEHGDCGWLDSADPVDADEFEDQEVDLHSPAVLDA